MFLVKYPLEREILKCSYPKDLKCWLLNDVVITVALVELTYSF